MNEQEESTELSEDMEMVSPGQMLSEARKNLGLSCEDVSDKLNFRVNLVSDIENDVFDKSLPATFNRGYLRNYAKLVKISAEDVISSYEAINVAELQGAELQSFSKETEKQAANNRLMWLSYLILALVIGSTIMWWMQNKHIVNNSGQSTQTAEPEVAAKVIEKVIESKTKLSDNTSTDIKDELNEAETTLALPTSNNAASEENLPISDEPINISEDNTLTVPVEDKTLLLEEPSLSMNDSGINTDSLSEKLLTPSELEDAPAPKYTELNDVAQTKVSFTFSGDCWVNIYDNSGERIAWGIKRSGYEMNISGQAPFTVTLGKPELVTIVFDGQNIDMKQFTAGNIAKFTLPIAL